MSKLISPQGVSLMLSPPPYSPPEPELPPREGTPPPPSSTMDWRGNTAAAIGSDDTTLNTSDTAAGPSTSAVTATTSYPAPPPPLPPLDAGLPPYQEETSFTQLLGTDVAEHNRDTEATSLIHSSIENSEAASRSISSAAAGAVGGIGREGALGGVDCEEVVEDMVCEGAVGGNPSERAEVPLLHGEEYNADTLPVTHRAGLRRNTGPTDAV